MKDIAFIDTEIEPKSGRILDLGGIKGNGDSFHSGSVAAFIGFLRGSEYICGHNIIKHDLKYIKNAALDAGIKNTNFIDTLYLSPLLFPKKPYHALVKDDKLQTDDINNPLNDSIKAKDLFFEEVEIFRKLDYELKRIFYTLLRDKNEFSAFFTFISEISKSGTAKNPVVPDAPGVLAKYEQEHWDPEKIIRDKFRFQICQKVSLGKMISQNPIELSYCLAIINTRSRNSITPPWVLKNFPEVERIMFLLRNNPCLEGCDYCNEALDIHKALKRYFGYDSYRTYDGESLQEKAVKSAVSNKSLLAVFPTGGGKSITFQVPALMSGINSKGLTVVISPLQSLMKDQVDNLEKAGITEAVTINGLLDREAERPAFWFTSWRH